MKKNLEYKQQTLYPQRDKVLYNESVTLRCVCVCEALRHSNWWALLEPMQIIQMSVDESIMALSAIMEQLNSWDLQIREYLWLPQDQKK